MGEDEAAMFSEEFVRTKAKRWAVFAVGFEFPESPQLTNDQKRAIQEILSESIGALAHAGRLFRPETGLDGVKHFRVVPLNEAPLEFGDAA